MYRYTKISGLMYITTCQGLFWGIATCRNHTGYCKNRLPLSQWRIRR